MTVSVGDPIPDVPVQTLTADGPATLQTGDVLGKGKIVLFAVPGAFTPGCSRIHLPGYLEHLSELHAAGVDKVACTAVNDAWVMGAWSRDHNADGILMLADGSGTFATAMGLTFDGSQAGLGLRSQRYAAIIQDGIITSLDVEPTGGVNVSSCTNMLAKVR